MLTLLSQKPEKFTNMKYMPPWPEPERDQFISFLCSQKVRPFVNIRTNREIIKIRVVLLRQTLK